MGSDRDWMVAPGGHCEVCGRELGAEPHLITRAPDGEHLECRDWARHPWPPPLERLAGRLRARHRALRRAMALTTRLGSYLNERRLLWPDGAAETIVEVARRERELRDALERAGLRPA